MSILPGTSLGYGLLSVGSTIGCIASGYGASKLKDENKKIGLAVLSSLLGLAALATAIKSYQLVPIIAPTDTPLTSKQLTKLLPDGGVDLSKVVLSSDPSLKLEGLPITKGTWEQIVKLQPTVLEITNCAKVVDEDLKFLAQLPHLDYLSLNDLPDLTGNGWHHLRELKELETLFLEDVPFDDVAMGYLVDCPLYQLSLSNITIQGAGLQALEKLTHLEILLLIDLHQLDIEHLKPLHLPETLTWLNISGAPLNDSHLIALENHPSLERLALIGCDELTDHIATYFPTMPRLDKIQIPYSKGFETLKTAQCIEQWKANRRKHSNNG